MFHCVINPNSNLVEMTMKSKFIGTTYVLDGSQINNYFNTTVICTIEDIGKISHIHLHVLLY
jgi:hypothetical protein